VAKKKEAKRCSICCWKIVKVKLNFPANIGAPFTEYELYDYPDFCPNCGTKIDMED